MFSIALAALMAIAPGDVTRSRSTTRSVGRVDTVVSPTIEQLKIVAVEDPGAYFSGSYGNISPTYTAPDQYYGALVGDYMRAEMRQSQGNAGLEAAILTLANKVNELAAKVGATPLPVPTPVATPEAPQPQPQPQPQPTPQPAEQPTATAGSDLGQSAVKILAERCSTCHMGNTPSGGFTLFAAPNQLAPLTADQLLLIDYLTYAGYMPPGPKHEPLNADEYSALRAWLNEQTELVVATLKSRS